MRGLDQTTTILLACLVGMVGLLIMIPLALVGIWMAVDFLR